MSMQRLSSYRLREKAHKVADFVDKERFEILVSDSSAVSSQFFVMHHTWREELRMKQTALPLAHVQISKTTNKVKFVLWQPSAFGLFDTEILKLKVINLLTKQNSFSQCNA